MKIAIPFMRRRRPNPRKPRHAEMVTTWTTRDWADLPVHHPRTAD